MAAFSTAYLNAALDGADALVKSIAVLDGGGTEVDRQSVTVPSAASGQATVTPSFTIPASTTIATYGIYDATTAGSTLKSGNLPNGGDTFNSGGTYNLSVTFKSTTV